MNSIRHISKSGIRKASLLLTLVIVSFTLPGQNLVPNGSFEDFSSCPPTAIDAQGRIDLLNNWFIPSGGGTPDFFSSCHIPFTGWPSVDVPNNTWGSQNARTGSCYAGFAPSAEYIEVQLIAPLTAGAMYDFEMYVSMGDEAQQSTDGLGVFFSDGPATVADGWGNAQVNNGVFNFITNSSGWVLITGSYTAAGGEDHITIGNFFSSFFPVSNPAGTMALSYYFIDDVSLVQQLVLPVELTSIKAECKGESVTISWVTATELNNDFFSVERSYDGRHFELVETLKGAGNSTIERHYSMIDDEIRPGRVYYRLRQTDFNGALSISHTVSVNIQQISETLTVYPNPMGSEGKVTFSSYREQIIELVVYNAMGQPVIVRELMSHKGENLFDISTLDLAAGLYYITVCQEQGTARTVQFYKL